jgi:putative methyltransferase (TIGR04325 family)
MLAVPRLASIKRLALRAPFVRRALNYRYGRHFNAAAGHVRLFRGLYPDFASAAADIPKSRLQGHDHDVSALRLAHDVSNIYPFDYPILFWLQKLLPECKLLFDLGGNVGISYFAYQKYLSYPQQLVWQVCDLPAVAKRGEAIAAEKGTRALSFTSSLDGAASADILLAAGSLQFIERPFEALRAVGALPRHILINKLPAYDLPAAVTLHNLGTSFCAYQLFNRSSFVDQFRALGYQVTDEWQSPDISCHIPYYPEHCVAAYSGFYFSRR